MIKRNYYKFYIPLILLAAIILLIFFNSLGWLAGAKNIFFKVAAPILKPFAALGGRVSGSIKFLTQIKNLAQENARLKAENELGMGAVFKLAEAERENDFLRKQLALVPPIKSRLVLADVVGFEPGNIGEYFFIKQGEDIRVSIGQAVIYASGFLTGKIHETEGDFAKVMALVDPASSVFAVSEETRASGVVRGDHGVGLILDMVPPDKEVKTKEIIISSGLDGQIPRGLIIGEVAEKISVSSDIFQRFKIKPAVNYKELERVFVVAGNE